MSAHPSAFEQQLAHRVAPLLRRLEDAGFVQVASHLPLPHRFPLFLGARRTRDQPPVVQVYRYEEHLVVTAPGSRSFGGPLDLSGTVHDALLAAGFVVAPAPVNRRREYRAEIPRAEPDRAAVLVARSLALLGARDVEAVTIATDGVREEPTG